MCIHCVSAHALFASLQLDWAITTGRLLGPTTCLPHEDGGVKCFAQVQNKQACRIILHTIPILQSAKQEAVNTIFIILLV